MATRIHRFGPEATRIFPILGAVLFVLTVSAWADKYTALANDKYNDKKYQQAIALYKKAIVEGENPGLAYYNIANAYYTIDSLAQAVVYYKATIKFAPEFFRGYLNLATVYYSLEEYGECIATLLDAKRLEDEFNSNSTVKLLLASAYESTRRPRNSSGRWRKIPMNIAPTWPWARYTAKSAT
jgi:tetratricopeptide (TPR) repeat protein